MLHFLPEVATVDVEEDEQVVAPPAKMARTVLTGSRLGGGVKPVPITPMRDVPDRRGEFQAPLPRSNIDIKLKEIDIKENYEFYDYFLEKEDSQTILRKVMPGASQKETGSNEHNIKEEVRNLKRSFNSDKNFIENYGISVIDDFLPDDGCTQGTSASRLCHQQSHGLQAQLGASALAGPVRGLQGDHKMKEDGLVAAATTMTKPKSIGEDEKFIKLEDADKKRNNIAEDQEKKSPVNHGTLDRQTYLDQIHQLIGDSDGILPESCNLNIRINESDPRMGRVEGEKLNYLGNEKDIVSKREINLAQSNVGPGGGVNLAQATNR